MFLEAALCTVISSVLCALLSGDYVASLGLSFRYFWQLSRHATESSSGRVKRASTLYFL